MRLESNNLFRELETRLKPATLPSDQDVSAAGIGTSSFIQSLSSALKEVDREQMQTDDALDTSVRGQGPELYKVLPAAEEAGLAFQMTMQFRNKALEAYQEVMKMQF